MLARALLTTNTYQSIYLYSTLVVCYTVYIMLYSEFHAYHLRHHGLTALSFQAATLEAEGAKQKEQPQTRNHDVRHLSERIPEESSITFAVHHSTTHFRTAKLYLRQRNAHDRAFDRAVSRSPTVQLPNTVHIHRSRLTFTTAEWFTSPP